MSDNMNYATIKPVMIDRIQGGSLDGLDTHQSSYYRQGFDRCLNMMGGIINKVIVDPFARDCQWGTHTNDIDPTTKAGHHFDALEFLKTLDSSFADLILFDPPFSDNQAKRYGKGLANIYTDGRYMTACMFEIERIMKPGSYLLKLGYNSSKHRKGFEMRHMTIVNFGANRNDVIMTIWEKINHSLEEWVDVFSEHLRSEVIADV
jgi:hypothetical protein